jgi:hypothetical protein
MTLCSASMLVEQLKVNFSQRRNNETWIAAYLKVKTFCAENNLSVDLLVESTPGNANETVSETRRSTKRTVKSSLSMKDFVVTLTLGQRDEPITAISSSSYSSDFGSS